MNQGNVSCIADLIAVLNRFESNNRFSGWADCDQGKDSFFHSRNLVSTVVIGNDRFNEVTVLKNVDFGLSDQPSRGRQDLTAQDAVVQNNSIGTIFVHSIFHGCGRICIRFSTGINDRQDFANVGNRDGFHHVIVSSCGVGNHPNTVSHKSVFAGGNKRVDAFRNVQRGENSIVVGGCLSNGLTVFDKLNRRVRESLSTGFLKCYDSSIDATVAIKGNGMYAIHGDRCRR